MSNLEKYNNAFIESLEATPEQLANNLEYNTIPLWDSIGHMSLIAALEEAFDIEMETNDLIALSSYNKGKEILQKYDIEI